VGKDRRGDARLGRIVHLLRPRGAGGLSTITAEFAHECTHRVKAVDRSAGGAQRHPGARRGIEHPRGDHRARVTDGPADEDGLAAPHLSVLNFDLGAARGVPGVVDPRKKWDMGGMTLD